ncbi:hypothetical protein UCRPC4_g04269 [Phaeomoniella chlamydospora]|uniref:Uncharacterized protein n=1 Tax=Phaeomoniella chlamydospora TaxID=158046 RepID=A0A0G2GTG7_PHACM|nr:hypothetical protein UCRPC4_g04269 [Phaeomoniella chlamydospora]
MSDSPFIQAPTDPREKPILDDLVSIRDKLLLLKQDRSTYVKSQDVMPLYDEVIEQVHRLNNIRVEVGLEQNRVDTLLDDCFQLISLFFMTIGRNNEAPAVYSMTSTISRLLDHLKEAAFYSFKDLNSIENTLEKMHDTLERGKETYSPHLLVLMENRIQVCKKIVQSLKDYLSSISPELMPKWEKLVSILRAAAAANTRSKFNAAEIEGFKRELLEIEATMKDHKFVAEDGHIPPGQELTVGLLDRCLKWCDIVLEKQGKIEPAFEETYEQLLTIRNHLDKLTMTQAWSLRETDLFMLQRKLDRIDDSRKEGNFWCPQGNCASLHTQRTLLYLLRRSYAYIYYLLVSSEPVSEALLPVYNQLQTLRRCLVEVKKSGGVSNPRELYPYSMKLNSIDNMRVDGKFMIGKDIPEGQGSVIGLLSECYDLAYELRTAAEEAQADGVDTD